MPVDIGLGCSFSLEDGNIYRENGEAIAIKGIRQEVFKSLVENKGKYVSRCDIIKAVWGKDDLTIYNASLTQQIYLLRKDLEPLGLKEYLVSNPRYGYRLNTPPALVMKKNQGDDSEPIERRKRSLLPGNIYHCNFKAITSMVIILILVLLMAFFIYC